MQLNGEQPMIRQPPVCSVLGVGSEIKGREHPRRSYLLSWLAPGIYARGGFLAGVAGGRESHIHRPPGHSAGPGSLDAVRRRRDLGRVAPLVDLRPPSTAPPTTRRCSAPLTGSPSSGASRSSMGSAASPSPGPATASTGPLPW
jgi:hypothetical protein